MRTIQHGSRCLKQSRLERRSTTTRRTIERSRTSWGAPLNTEQRPLDIAISSSIAFLLEEFDGKPLARRLIAAYIVGQPLNARFY
jgi:hypothetical protein